jgi:hypothetical protein
VIRLSHGLVGEFALMCKFLRHRAHRHDGTSCPLRVGACPQPSPTLATLESTGYARRRDRAKVTGIPGGFRLCQWCSIVDAAEFAAGERRLSGSNDRRRLNLDLPSKDALDSDVRTPV